ncbi:MAG: DNA gyrase modulator [Planctomycetota bacterium]
MLSVLQRFRTVAPGCDAWTARITATDARALNVRQGVLSPVTCSSERGVQIAVRIGDSEGWAATADISDTGLRAAGERAKAWALAVAGRSLIAASTLPIPVGTGTWKASVIRRWEDQPIGEAVDVLRVACTALKRHERIVDWGATLWSWTTRSALLSSAGAAIEQERSIIVPNLSATAHADGESQTR